MVTLIPVFIASFFLSLNFGATLYVNAVYLEQFFPSSIVSMLFLLGAMGNIYLFFKTPRLLNSLGKEKLLFLLLFITAVSTFLASIATEGILAAAAFLVYSSVFFLTYYCLDIFIEEKSRDDVTGGIRGLYGTIFNTGIALGPILSIMLNVETDFRPVYALAASLIIVPLSLSIYFLTRKFQRWLPSHEEHKLPWERWWQKRNVRAVTLARLVLETFYGLLIIYTPLYLHNVLNFEWRELGIIFTISLLPFIFIEWPAGKLADKKLGEKEMMSLGFFLMGIALLIMPYLDKSFLAWVLVLPLSRVGAALVEIMTETYFFKKIHATDTGFLSIFRLVRPLGIIFGAALGALSVALFPYPVIFLVLSLVVFCGLYESLHLKDTL